MCGIFAAFNARKAAELCVMGLHGIQHRAIEFAGIATGDGNYLYRHAGPGLARQVFADPATLDRLHGKHAVGHLRYSTAERKQDKHYCDPTQPIMGHWGGQEFALAHNGNLTNVAELDALLIRPRRTAIDTECIARLLEERQSGELIADLVRAFRELRGSYSLALLRPDELIAARDPSGCRPLCLGRKGEAWFVSSETCAFGNVEAEFVREVEPGEIVRLSPAGMESLKFAAPRLKRCRFEGNYFSHPASLTFGEAVDEYRIRLGRTLEEHCPAIGADIVTPVPDSSNFIAMGYGESGRSGIYRPVILRSHYVGRTFIEESQVKRDTAVANKFSFTAHAIEGKRIVVVDDSIVRGTTLTKIVSELRRYGAKEIHLRSASPPILHPCRYGIDTPSHGELVAANLTPQHICTALGADSLEYLPLPVQKELSPEPDSFCYACMNGEYWDRQAAAA